jgi:leucyl aminopeptidase
MLNCFITETNQKAITISLILKSDFTRWLSTQTEDTKSWLTATQFRVDENAVSLIPDASGKISLVLCCVETLKNLWSIGNLPFLLPEGIYQFSDNAIHDLSYAIGWGLGAYQFTRYKSPSRQPAQLLLPPSLALQARTVVESIYLVRNLINTPTDDMGPTQLAEVASQLATEHGASFQQIVGQALLEQNYASIYTVGRASDDAPRLLDLRWGNPSHPKVTLVGKGVCFDSGGLDIKSSTHMTYMKKDMAGGAHVLGLARMIMQTKLPVCLRVLIPAVENVIAGNAYRPGDIIKSRKGLTIEVGNTDAEGRLILADALTEAASENPECLIDISTLTGAARIALGTELPAVFSNNEDFVHAVIKQGEKANDLMWRLPLFAPYREHLNSSIADINNNSSEPYGGAISAALFLKEFVPDNIPWLHFDLMAWNLRAKPGRPQGGEAGVLRALFNYLCERYINK